MRLSFSLEGQMQVRIVDEFNRGNAGVMTVAEKQK